MAIEVRTLRPGDESRLSAFLETRAESSMFLRANLAAAGLVDTGAPYSGTYIGALEGGRVLGVAALFWNGNLMLQAPEHLGPILSHLSGLAVRPIRGLLGPYGQAVEARRLLGLADAPTQKDSHEDLFALDLADLAVPAPLTEGRWVARRSRDADLPQIKAWRLAANLESSSIADTPELRAEVEEFVERNHRERVWWVLETEGRLVAMSNFNARIPDTVQIGAVYTPPDLRGKGYARASVAGSLLAARAEGVTRSILFTGRTNIPAQKAYRAIGFRVVGDYALIAFDARL
jgi:RimJ/RimL family protein N-acetyltransferase